MAFLSLKAQSAWLFAELDRIRRFKGVNGCKKRVQEYRDVLEPPRLTLVVPEAAEKIGTHNELLNGLAEYCAQCGRCELAKTSRGGGGVL